jgi:hypothetical protein
LKGQTPRAASANPALRPILIRLMKSRVRSSDDRNLRKGGNEDVNWMLKELGLDEILFEPPPKRPNPDAEFEDEDDNDNENDEVWEDSTPDPSDLPWAPTPPTRPLTLDEVYEAIEASLRNHPTAVEAVHALEAEGNWLIGELAHFTEGLLPRDLFALMVPALIHAWRMFVPCGTRGPELDLERLQTTIGREVKHLARVLEKSRTGDFESFLHSGPQPALTSTLGNLILTGVDELPRHDQPEPNHLAMALIFLRAVVEEIDTACHEQ